MSIYDPCPKCGVTHKHPTCQTPLTSETPSDAANCRALVDALSDVLPQHTMACVSGLNTYCQPWSFAVTDDGSPLVTLESCQCSGESMKYLRGLLPEGHSKGFSYNKEITGEVR